MARKKPYRDEQSVANQLLISHQRLSSPLLLIFLQHDQTLATSANINSSCGLALAIANVASLDKIELKRFDNNDNNSDTSSGRITI